MPILLYMKPVRLEKLRILIDYFCHDALHKALVGILFLLPFIIPVWTISRTSSQYETFQKIRILNEEGIRWCNQKEYSKSISHFQGALRLDPDNKTVKSNLASAYTELAVELKSKGNADQAIIALEKASELNTGNENVHVLLAKLYFEKGDLMYAEREARIALIMKPGDPYLLKFLAHVNFLLEDFNEALDQYHTLADSKAIPENSTELNRLKQEQEVVNTYKKTNCHPFIVYYPDDTYEQRAKWIAESLVRVYLKLGSWWNFNPQHEIPVYMYPENTFFRVTRSSAGVIGVYDGKIRLLVNHDHKIRLQKTAVHEYTHFALNGLTHMNIPFWCNEGIAQYVAGEWDPIRAKMFDVAIERRQMMDFKDMDTEELSSFFDTHDRTLAYIQSYVAILFLVEQYGEKSITELISCLKKGWTAEKAVEHITLLSYAEFTSDLTAYYLQARKDDAEGVRTVLSRNENPL
ncbi:MAG: hypothetical protein C4541_06285 [Candidatus Auribacter fodinae]|uniref:Peptidase MA-like domain-containing protein n=1 Tax=Candidatus Auribacter fodinae TaxID=2093366 RepID=A0A3A4R2X8_9BACT|nr:MAG: hypothetical protein C4541_06285 [Candidatus Auribacter fodinae]